MEAGRSDERIPLAQEPASGSERLVLAIAGGDRDAERELAVRYAGPVRAMLLARSRNPDLAADLLQDVMIEAICALRRGQLNDPAKLSAFIQGIARNLLSNHFRSSRRTETLELPDDLPDLRLVNDRLEEREWQERALAAISSLDRIDRAILQMTLVDGMKPGAIAARLRLNPEVVRQRKLRATRRVIEMLGQRSQSAAQDHSVPGRAK